MAIKKSELYSSLWKNCATAEISKDYVLSKPYFKQPNGGLKTFDFVVSNPPFSTKAWSHELAERYAIPLPSIELEVKTYKLKVEDHLRRMGFDWQAVTSKGGVIA